MLAVVAVATLALPASARAQGSSVMTHTACGVAMASAGVASPCEDGSAVFFSPAALALQPGVLGLGASGIYNAGEFTYDFGGPTIDRDATTTWVPFGYLNYRVRDDLAAAIGVFAPYGLGLEWPVCPATDPNCGADNFEGRYVSYDSQLTNIYIQPTISYAPRSFISFGAGVDVVLSSIAINQRIDLATTTAPQAAQVFPGRTLTFQSFGIALGTDFADANLEGNGTGVTFHLGALARLTEQLSIGARYLHSVEIDYDGDADFTQVPTNLVLPPGNPISQPGNPFGFPAGSAVPLDPVLQTQFGPGAPLEDQPISTSLELPAQFVVGLAYHPTPEIKILGDYQWTRWESFDRADIAFEGAAPDVPLVLDYENTDTYRAGIEFDPGTLQFRAGFIYNTAAEREFSVSPLLPEAERNYYSLGLGYRLTPMVTIDLGYQLVDQADRRGRVRGRPPGLSDAELEALNVGVYATDAHIFSGTLSYRFGPAR